MFHKCWARDNQQLGKLWSALNMNSIRLTTLWNTWLKDISTWPWEHFANPCPTSQKGNVQACVPSLLIMIPLSGGGSGWSRDEHKWTSCKNKQHKSELISTTPMKVHLPEDWAEAFTKPAQNIRELEIVHVQGIKSSAFIIVINNSGTSGHNNSVPKTWNLIWFGFQCYVIFIITILGPTLFLWSLQF